MSKTVYLECDVRIGSVKDYDDNPLDFRVSTEDNEIVITVDIKDFALTPHNVLNYVNDSDNMKEILSESCGSGLESAAYEIVHHLSENDDHHYRSLLSDLCLTPDEEIDADKIATFLESTEGQESFVKVAGLKYKTQLLAMLMLDLRTDDTTAFREFLTANGLMVDSTPSKKQAPIKVGYIYRCLNANGTFDRWDFIRHQSGDAHYPIHGISRTYTLDGTELFSTSEGSYIVLDSGVEAPSFIHALTNPTHLDDAVDAFMKSTLV